MIRFLISLFLFFLFLSVNAQNLIPNPSVEDYIDCPETLQSIQDNVIPWQKLRGTPDYFNSCSENPLLGWNNVAGNQEPRTGEGYLGALTYDVVENAREYVGVEFNSPLQVGESYTLTFYTSLAYDFNNTNMASNNIGCLLMTDNYLSPADDGPIPNFSHFSMEEVLLDTTNWTEISFTFEADSVYTMLAIGNFYDDDNTIAVSQIDGQKYDVTAYYFLDDFCLTPTSGNCDSISFINEVDYGKVKVYPNPNHGSFQVSSEFEIIRWSMMDLSGRIVRSSSTSCFGSTELEFKEQLDSGIYLLVLKTEKGVVKRRIILQNK